LVAHLPEDRRQCGFDTLILADLLFNHSEHEKLVKTLQQTMNHTNSCALVFFTPYRPWLLKKDLSFFEKAEEGGFQIEKIVEKVMDKVLFENDPGVYVPSETEVSFKLTRTGRIIAKNRVWLSAYVEAIERAGKVECVIEYRHRYIRSI